MATKKNVKKASANKAVDPEKEAKRKARLEAIKNRPAVQRPNSKQIDVIEGANGTKVCNFGYPIKKRNVHVGVLVTSVSYDGKGNITGSSIEFVPGELTVKAKKGHGTICNPKQKGDSTEDEEVEEE